MTSSMLRWCEWDWLHGAAMGAGASTEKTQCHKVIRVKRPDPELISL